MRRNKEVNEENAGQIMIECPNTIFHIYVNDEHELSKIEMFMGNIRSVSHLGINDIYRWCNRQGMKYDTEFNYNKNFSIWKNLASYIWYSKHKMKYQVGFSVV